MRMIFAIPLLLGAASAPVQAAVAYDEGTSGDLSNNGLSPTLPSSTATTSFPAPAARTRPELWTATISHSRLVRTSS